MMGYLSSDVKAALPLSGNRDLAVTTDLRDVFAEILQKRMGISNLPPVFSGY